MIAVVMEFVCWLVDYLFSKRKTIVGKHRPETVTEVSHSYHPMPECCAYPGLWEARVSGRVDYLRVPLKVFYALVGVGKEIDRAMWLSNYRWAEVTTDEWPESWKAEDEWRVWQGMTRSTDYSRM